MNITWIRQLKPCKCIYFSLLTITGGWLHQIYSRLLYWSLNSGVVNPILVSIEHLWDTHCIHSKTWHLCQWAIKEVNLHNGFVLHFHWESKYCFRFFSCLCHGQPVLSVCHGKTQSQLTASYRMCEWNIFRLQRKYSANFKEQRFGTVLILSQLILFSWGSGRLSAFKWDEIHLKTVTLQVSEKSQILLETNIFNYIWHSQAYCCHFSTTDGNRLGNVQHN